MIRNTYVFSKKDAIFISKSVYFNLRNLRFILSVAVEVILGIALLIYFFPWWKAVFVYRQLVSAQDMFWLLASSIVGWICISYPIWMPILYALCFYKFQADKKHFPEIELGEDGIVVKQSVEGAFSERHFEYSLLDGYVVKNHAVYIRITVQESTSYLVLHDDTYLEGSKAELLELFERKNIKQLGNLNEKTSDKYNYNQERREGGWNMLSDITVKELYDLNETIAAELFADVTYPWEVLPRIHDFILELGAKLPEERFEKRGEDIWVAKSAKVAPTACLNGPLIIDEEAEIRHCAFIRGNAIVGKGAVVGNSTELKNVVLFNKVQVPHYNYVGDSVLGFKAHMGAGSITSNVKSDKTLVAVKGQGEDGDFVIETGLKKMGAMLGDCVEVGCNSVLNPGTVIGRESNVYPTSCVRGVIPARHIYKDSEHIVRKAI